jgi:hypothetical protein
VVHANAVSCGVGQELGDGWNESKRGREEGGSEGGSEGEGRVAVLHGMASHVGRLSQLLKSVDAREHVAVHLATVETARYAAIDCQH